MNGNSTILKASQIENYQSPDREKNQLVDDLKKLILRNDDLINDELRRCERIGVPEKTKELNDFCVRDASGEVCFKGLNPEFIQVSRSQWHHERILVENRPSNSID